VGPKSTTHTKIDQDSPSNLRHAVEFAVVAAVPVPAALAVPAGARGGGGAG
jgi:hypothetical protein